MLINIWIIISAVLFILILWGVVAVRHLKFLKKEINEQWELVDERLRKRQNLLPNFIETIRTYVKDQEVLLEKIVADRMKAAKEYSRGAQKIEYEHELSMDINQLIDLKKSNGELAKDTNFLEVKTEIELVEQDLDAQSGKYNEMVRYYNKHRDMILLRPVAAIFSFGMINIFEVET